MLATGDKVQTRCDSAEGAWSAAAPGVAWGGWGLGVVHLSDRQTSKRNQSVKKVTY